MKNWGKQSLLKIEIELMGKLYTNFTLDGIIPGIENSLSVKVELGKLLFRKIVRYKNIFFCVFASRGWNDFEFFSLIILFGN
jgi:hypothetical protein